MKQILLALGLLAFAASADAQLARWQKGLIEHRPVFDSASFPESHAATIAETPGGLIAAWFGGTKERNPDVEIWVSRREGKQWTAPYPVADGKVNDTLRYACWNPVLFQVPRGPLLLFYKTGPNVAKWKAWMKRSLDGGRTWSAPIALPEGFIGPVKNKPLLLSDGTLIAPSSKEGNGWRIHMEISKDTGRTWTMVTVPGTTDAIQPTLLRYRDGRLQLLARSKNRVMMESWSTDNGASWSELKAGTLPNNNSGFDAVTLKDGRQLLVYNHVLPADSLKNGKGPRTPLNLAWSTDGRTWYAAMILEDSPISQYSYPSIIQSADGKVHVVYTWRRKRINFATIDPKKLEGVKIADGVWPARKGYRAPLLSEVKAEE